MSRSLFCHVLAVVYAAGCACLVSKTHPFFADEYVPLYCDDCLGHTDASEYLQSIHVVHPTAEQIEMVQELGFTQETCLSAKRKQDARLAVMQLSGRRADNVGNFAGTVAAVIVTLPIVCVTFLVLVLFGHVPFGYLILIAIVLISYCARRKQRTHRVWLISWHTT